MWHEVLVAMSLVLVIEGAIPFLNPGLWRKIIVNVAQQDERSIRIIGLTSMVVGSTLLYFISG